MRRSAAKPFHIRGRLTSRKGCKVWFKPPSDVAAAGGGYVGGEIMDEVWARPNVNDSPARVSTGSSDWGDYSFCAQRIRWAHGGHSIRLAYYRRRAGEDAWHFGSQMTVTGDAAEIRDLLQKTLEKTAWFADEGPNQTLQPTAGRSDV